MVVNRYFLTSIYTKVSRYCIDVFQTVPLMTPPNMHSNVTQIHAKLLSVMNWIDSSHTSSVLWFNGSAGAGKTAIAQSLCKRCAAAQWLAGSFFFSRQVSGRNNADFLFSTISFELSLAIPDVGKIIDEVVANDPSIPTKALEVQLIISRP